MYNFVSRGVSPLASPSLPDPGGRQKFLGLQRWSDYHAAYAKDQGGPWKLVKENHHKLLRTTLLANLSMACSTDSTFKGYVDG